MHIIDYNNHKQAFENLNSGGGEKIMKKFNELKPEQLKPHWDPDILPFETTEEIEPVCDIIGQERAVRAMEFGIKIKKKGYNLYISGVSGTGKTSYAKEYINKIAKDEKTPDDWCYLYNFDNPSNPIAVNLPAGKGKQFQQDIHQLISELKIEIPKAFRGQDYENEKTLMIKKLQDERSKIFNKFSEYAREQGFQVNISNSGIYFIPIVDGEPMEEEEYNKLDDDTKKHINEKLTQIQLEAVDMVRRIRELEKDVKKQAAELDNRIGLFAVGLRIDGLKEKYKDYPKIVEYLENLKKDIIENIDEFREEEAEETNPFVNVLRRGTSGIKNKYTVNLLVDNSHIEGAPVIVEFNPTYNTLFGSLEYENRFGLVSTDFTLIKPGSVHLANGGYLILQAKDILSTPFLWEGLKKILKTKSISIENLRDQLGLVSISSLKPEPIPIDIKVVLIGSDYLYQLLYELDEDFRKLFKIKVDFDDEMPASRHNLICLAGFISGLCKRENLLPFSKDAVIKVAEYSSRLVEDQHKLSTRFNNIIEILIEANAWAQMEGQKLVNGENVKKAIREKEYRSNKYDEKWMEMLKDGTIMIDTDGEVVGQINALSIIEMGDVVFGKPLRITATTFMGESGIVNVEREVAMSGTTHSKGVMILSGYIGEQYAQEVPLALNANITFEQLYGEVDGDSASSAELYAILSSLAEVPIKQGIAVTGSVNQKGEIQPVGGVTHKIEGFFNLCKKRGLTGEQGVIIPRKNIHNLVLKDEVIEAVREGKFHIYPIDHIDEGIEILMGLPAGKKLEDGFFEKGSVHEKAYNKIRQYALTMANFGKEDSEDNISQKS